MGKGAWGQELLEDVREIQPEVDEVEPDQENAHRPAEPLGPQKT